MSKKLRRFLIALTIAIVAAAAGFHFGISAPAAALADRDLRLRHLYSLWENMCVDNATEKAECDAAWERAQSGR